MKLVVGVTTIAVGMKLRDGCTFAAHLHRRLGDTVAAHMTPVLDEMAAPHGKKRFPPGGTSHVRMKLAGLGHTTVAPLEEVPVGDTNDFHMKKTAVGEGGQMCLDMRMRFDVSFGMSKTWSCRARLDAPGKKEIVWRVVSESREESAVRLSFCWGREV